MPPELKIILYFKRREHAYAFFFSEFRTDFFLRHFYGLKYFRELKAYQITLCAIVSNVVHFQFQVTTSKCLKNILR